MTQAQTAAPHGYVLGATEGEHLIHFRDGGNVFINVGPATGSGNLALGTQQVPVGAGIPIHRHLRVDEAFYVLNGSGIFTLNDAGHPFEKGRNDIHSQECLARVRESRSRTAAALDHGAARTAFSLLVIHLGCRQSS